MQQDRGPDRASRDAGQFDERQFDQQRDQRFDRGFEGQFDQRSELELNRRLDQDSMRRPDSQSAQRFEADVRDRQDMRGQDRQDRRGSGGQGGQQIDLGAEFSSSPDALSVSSVNQGTLAAEIGLRENDEIVSVGGRNVTSADQLNDVLVRSQTFQDRIPIVVRRGNQPTTLYVQPQILRETFVVPPRPADPGLGFVVAPLAGDRLIVQEVVGGLADVIGLRENDVILSVAGRPVATQEQFADILYSVDADQIPVIIIRDGQREVLYIRQDQLNFRMYDAPDMYVAANAWLGVVLDTRYPDSAVVRSVVANSPADRAGVRRGDVIERVNGRQITSADHLTWLISSLQPGQEVELDVSRRVSGTLVARLEGERPAPPRQAVRPTYDYYPPAPGEAPVQQRQYYRGEIRGEIIDDYDADLNRTGPINRVGPAERGLRDRLDPDQRPNGPRGLFRRR